MILTHLGEAGLPASHPLFSAHKSFAGRKLYIIFNKIYLYSHTSLCVYEEVGGDCSLYLPLTYLLI